MALENGPAVAEIEAELALARRRVTMSVRALGDELNRRREWRAWVRAHPMLTLGLSAALGFLVGRSPRPIPTSRGDRHGRH